ncbi:hypothetical protein QF038_001612 [Pseudarthrobacter sp. W1I19]|uniref:hypothetical protein n=1 Tax=Pseudarthrobacter sp. W1I19 TaxID=3042288 RepID=UPI0027881432|nr:hypothetical protein [Pseudarthrobacter sp. W1I19]MDQ0923104.1 hypothetical protein [Pseudarthrobacter sp. W1I19]
MAGKNITDQDILAALKGRSTEQAGRSAREVSDALNGRPSAQERANQDAIAKAFGREPQRAATEGEVPLQRRGDGLEAVAIWAARESADAATKALAEAIMRTDGSKGIYLAESEAHQIAVEAYTEAAKTTPYEDKRQESVSRFLTKLAEKLARTLTPESKAPRAAAAEQQAPSGKPLKKRESRSATNSNHTIISYS